ncbi:integrase [Vibrio inusitatus NBRC 102082]|uniref:Integrase n=1 Tax=Vibrio inusitatus NBRC 102082 TaxID=1219070 RepID=A0A4Y3HYT2_9VIBR|nr:DUF3596 domain-containing protein [Vibrio inusitatus]GEA52343.1 integrase [Vibrio inusitatus NBRC 102082]
MAHIRIRPNGRIQFDIHLYGVRFREGTKMMATPSNLAKAKAMLKRMNAEIDLNCFEYRDYFPHSKKVAKFELLQRGKHPDRLYPFFEDFAQEWYQRQIPKWKSSYQNTMRNILERYLIPEFGNTLMSDFTLAKVDFYRNQLMEETKPDGTRRLSNRRINSILWPIIAMVGLAADEYQFEYPLRRYRALKEEKANSKPLTIAEVKRFLAAVEEKWRDYFILRFWTGMRSCEVHGLLWKYVDFEHRLIQVRHNYVNGELCDVKTPKSRRDLKMCDALYEALKRQQARCDTDSDYVFTNDKGLPLDTHWISKGVWYPTLKKAGLAKRRAYETRHTAAVLHIAALENPLYISQMLGHSDTQLLFNVYAPYVANASRNDGSAFNELMNQEGL